jgi:hypothetical protein
MAGYIRQDVSNNIANGNVIDADDFDNEFDALASAFSATVGHTHDGSSAEGAPITVVGPGQDVVVSATAVTPKADNTYDLGSPSNEWKDLYLDGTANIDNLVANTGTVGGEAITTTSNTQTLTNKTLSAPVITGDVTVADRIIHSGDTNTAIRFPAADTVTVETNGAERMRITSAGNVGIGTTGPTTLLQVQAPAGTGSQDIFRVSSVAGGSFQIRCDDIAVANPSWTLFTNASEPMAFAVAATEVMRLTPTGNVGIGTNSPATALDVNGTITATGWSGGGIVTETATQTLTNKTLTAPTMTGAVLNDGYTEEVFAVTGTTPALSPDNGSIQTWTLSGNSTPTQTGWDAGQSITLLVEDGADYTITWTSLSIVWKTDGGSAPTLNTSGDTVIGLWKVGTTIYGARVGDA